MNTNETSHSPIPWMVADHHGVIDVMGKGSGVCRVFTDPCIESRRPTMAEARANADLIVRAVNAHADLIAALDRIARAAANREATVGDVSDIIECRAEVRDSIVVARAALANAKGGE